MIDPSLTYDPPAHERREHRRLPFNHPVRLVWLSEGQVLYEPSDVIAEDISRGGIRLKSPAEFRVGRDAIIQFERPDGTYANVGIHVIYADRPTANASVAGARFIPLPKDLLRNAISSPRRRWR